MKITIRQKLSFLFSIIILAIICMSFPNSSIKPTAVFGQETKKAAIKSKVTKRKKKAGKKRTKKRRRRRVKTFALNFNNVEISEFLNIMSQLIGKNIVTHDRVRGKITISSAKKIPVKEAYEIMKSILEVKGFAVVETKNLIKVIPIRDAVKKNVKVIVDGKRAISAKDKNKTITYLLELESADSSEVSNALRQLKSKNIDLVVYPALNTIIFSGTGSEIRGLVKIAKELDKAKEAEEIEGTRYKGFINVVHLENADADKLAAVLSRIPFSDKARISSAPITKSKIRKSSRAKQVTRAYSPGRSSKSKLSIIANKETNSLIITASPDEFREIRRIIRELDIVREQVLIEALIVEVNAESGWGFGIDWMAPYQSGNAIFGGSSINGSIPSFSKVDGKTLALPLSTGFQLGVVSDTSLLGYALLSASATDSNFKILSTPQILTIDNHEAEINVGEDIPVPTNNRISDSGTQFYTFDYKPVGVKLKITPHITKKKRITLDLYQEVNSVLGETTVTDGGSLIPPKLGKRDIKTKVTVLNGKTIVVGGLIRNDKTVTETKVPILGDIPLLGWFFKRKSESYTKTNLLIFITPHIMTKQDKIDAITEQKRKLQKRMRNSN